MREYLFVGSFDKYPFVYSSLLNKRLGDTAIFIPQTIREALSFALGTP